MNKHIFLKLQILLGISLILFSVFGVNILFQKYKLMALVGNINDELVSTHLSNGKDSADMYLINFYQKSKGVDFFLGYDLKEREDYLDHFNNKLSENNLTEDYRRFSSAFNAQSYASELEFDLPREIRISYFETKFIANLFQALFFFLGITVLFFGLKEFYSD